MVEDGWSRGGLGALDGGMALHRSWLLFLSALIQNCNGDICNTHFMSPSLASALSYCSAVSGNFGLVSVAASRRHVLLLAANSPTY